MSRPHFPLIVITFPAALIAIIATPPLLAAQQPVTPLPRPRPRGRLSPTTLSTAGRSAAKAAGTMSSPIPMRIASTSPTARASKSLTRPPANPSAPSPAFTASTVSLSIPPASTATSPTAVATRSSSSTAQPSPSSPPSPPEPTQTASSTSRPPKPSGPSTAAPAISRSSTPPRTQSSPPSPCPASPSSPSPTARAWSSTTSKTRARSSASTRVPKLSLGAWPAGCDSPSGLAFDVAGHRLFPVCDGKKASVIDSSTGKLLANPTIGDGPDAAGWSAAHSLAFASSRDGILSVIHAAAPGYPTIESLTTQAGARTMTYDPSTDRVYLITADLGPRPDPTPANPRPRPPVIPGTFTVIVVGR